VVPTRNGLAGKGEKNLKAGKMRGDALGSDPMPRPSQGPQIHPFQKGIRRYGRTLCGYLDQGNREGSRRAPHGGDGPRIRKTLWGPIMGEEKSPTREKSKKYDTYQSKTAARKRHQKKKKPAKRTYGRRTKVVRVILLTGLLGIWTEEGKNPNRGRGCPNIGKSVSERGDAKRPVLLNCLAGGE